MKRFLPRLVCAVFSISCFGLIIAQDPSCDLELTGQVVDEHDHSALSYAEVYVTTIQRGAVCDHTGAFVIKGLCPGAYDLIVRHVGCEPVEQTVTLPRSKPMLIYLEHHSEDLRILEVQAERPDEQVGKRVNELSATDIENLAGRPLAEMLAQVEGVNVLRSGPTIAKPVIHGLSGDRIVLVDRGLRQEDQQWGVDHAPSVDPTFSGGIRVVKGAGSVEFGAGALGGVIVNEALPLHDLDSLSGQVQVGLSSNGRGGKTSALLQGPIGRNKRFSWRLQGTGDVGGDLRAPDYFITNTGRRSVAGTVELGWKHKLNELKIGYRYLWREAGVLRAAHIGNITDLQASLASGEPSVIEPFSYRLAAPRQVVQHQAATARYAIRLNEQDQLVLSYGVQVNDRQEFDIRRAGRSAIPSLDMTLSTHTVKAEHKHYWGKAVHGKLGFDGLYQRNVNAPGTGVRPLIPFYEMYSGGLFWIEHIELDKVELEFGARVDQRALRVVRFDENDQLQRPERDFTNWAINTGGVWNWSESLTMRMNIATAFRPPNISELFSEGLHHGSAAIEEGDPTLETERSLKGILSLDHTGKDERWTIGLTGYYDRIANYILLIPTGTRLTIQGAFPVFGYQAVDASLVGADLSVDFTLNNRVKLTNRSSVVYGRDRTNDIPLYRIPSARTVNGVEYTHEMGGGSLYVRLSHTSVAQQTRFPEGVDFADPPKGYGLLNASCRWDKHAHSISLSVDNMLNEKYRDLLDQFRYYSDALGTNLNLRFQTKF